MYPVAILTGPTCTGKTRIAIAVARTTNAILLPLDQLHRYDHLREGTGLDLGLLREVAHDGYGVLSPWEISGPCKYVEWLESAILRHGAKRPILVEGGCTSYLQIVLEKIRSDPVFQRVRVYALDENLTSSQVADRIGGLCTEDKVRRVVAEAGMLRQLGFITNHGLSLLQHCERVFTHPEHADPNLAWAVRISAKVYCPAYLALTGRLYLADARIRIIANAIGIHSYQTRRMREILGAHYNSLTYSEGRQTIEAMTTFLKTGLDHPIRRHEQPNCGL